MYRRPAGNANSHGFSRSARKVHPFNDVSPMRGGIRA